MRLTGKLVLAPLLASWCGCALWAQDSAEILNRMKAMEDRIRALEAEVQTLKGQQAAVAPAAPVAQAAPAQVAQAPAAAPAMPQESPRLGGVGGAAGKALNPDISVIGDFVGAAGNHGGRATPAL